MNALETFVNRLFDEEVTFKNKSENTDRLEFVASLTYANKLNEKVYSEMGSYISEGDKLSLIYDDGDEATDSSLVGKDSFLEAIKQTLDKTDVTLTLRIEKKITNGVLTVYDYSWFLKNVQDLSLKSCFDIFGDNYAKGLRKVSIKGIPANTSLSSAAFIFCSEDIADMPMLVNIDEAYEKIKTMKSCCHWDDASKNVLLPEVLMFTNSGSGNLSGLKAILNNMCFHQTIRFIYDYTTLTDDEFRYHISGYRAISGKVACKKVSEMADVSKSLGIFYNIYTWIYNEGNTADKLGIARNIITINGRGDSLEISESTIQAIKSNFNIYNQKNAERYITVRNQLSKTFLDLNKQMNTIADGFESDFTGNMKALLTFFLTVIILKAVSNSNTLTGFNLSISLIALVFIFASFLIKKHSQKTYDEKMDMLSKYVEDLKDRYRMILTEIELSELFNSAGIALEKAGNGTAVSNSLLLSYRAIVNKRQHNINKIWNIILILLIITISIVILVTGIIDIVSTYDSVKESIGVIKILSILASIVGFLIIKNEK